MTQPPESVSPAGNAAPQALPESALEAIERAFWAGYTTAMHEIRDGRIEDDDGCEGNDDDRTD
jgi:hypothetical protein